MRSAAGVYRLPWCGQDGERFYVAVDVREQKVLESTVPRGADPDPVVEDLWNQLDEIDSRPRLEVVR